MQGGGGMPPNRPTSKFGQERYAKDLQTQKLERDLAVDPNAPIPTMTPDQALSAGSIDPKTKVIDNRPQDNRDRSATISLSNEFSNQSKEFRLASQALPAVLNSSPDAAGDMQMVYGLMKIYDPTSVVRETEFANAENARGVPDSIRGTWNKMMNGERLTTQQRDQFRASARNVYEGRLSQQKQLESEFRRQGASFGLNPDQIVRDYSVPGLQTSQTGGTSKAPPVGTVESGYRFKGGNPSDQNSWEKI
jgi:hypothetical protein